MTDTRLFALCASAVTAAIAAVIAGFAAFVLVGVIYTYRATSHAQPASTFSVYWYGIAVGLSVAVITAFLVARPVYRLFAFRDCD